MSVELLASEIRVETGPPDEWVKITHIPTGEVASVSGYGSVAENRRVAMDQLIVRVAMRPGGLVLKDWAIPLANLHRLDLKPGESLAVILPDGVVSAQAAHEFTQFIQAQLDEYVPDVRAIVFPSGTKLNVVAPSTD